MFDRLFEAFEFHEKKLYHVGGSVRDMVLGKSPKDFDFTTDALPENTKSILEWAGYKTFPLGEKFGTIAARIDGLQVEITTHRKDMTLGRHPDVVFTKNLLEDLERRDFTFNSMAMGKDKKIIDPFGGRKHLRERIIKTTGSPMARFGEDPLRMLRAIRFVSKFGFNLDRQTRQAIYVSAQAIMNVSRERWLDELTKLLMGPFAGKALDLLLQTRLLGYTLPEVFTVTLKEGGELPSKDLWKHTKIVVGRAKVDPIVRWASLLHDIAKPQTRQETIDSRSGGPRPKATNYPKATAAKIGGSVHFFQHDALGAELVESVARRLHMSNDMRQSLVGLVFLHQRIGDVVSRRNSPPVSKNALRRLVRDCEDRKCTIDDLIELFAADCSSSRKDVQDRQAAHTNLLRKAIEEMNEEDLRPKLPSGIGKLIMNHFSLKPGPEVGIVRKMLDQMLIDGEVVADMPTPDMMLALESRLNKNKVPKKTEQKRRRTNRNGKQV